MKPIVRAASYNVHACVGADRRRDVDRVARVIAALGADIVGLQEVESTSDSSTEAGAQLATLAERTGFEPIAGPTLRRADDGFGNAILTRLPIQRVRHLPLTVPPFEARAALIATLGVGSGALDVAVTHLGLRWRERLRQARALCAALSAAEHPTLVLADANIVFPWSPALRVLNSGLGRCVARRTFPALRPLLYLDRAWINPSAAYLRGWVHRAPPAARASDHLPLCVELRTEDPS